jgi:uncharacterized protein YecE (DUF72 family)
MSEPETKIAVGVAGWSYPDWVGFVYDRSVRDGLAFLADYVDMVEVNSTFYRLPDARQTAAWLRRTQAHPEFFFTAKLSREITHEGSRDVKMIRSFLDGMRPLMEAQQLRAVLAQFRYDFTDGESSREHLRWVAGQVGAEIPVVLELRHRSWQQNEALDFLRGLGVSVAHLDYPIGRESFDVDVCPGGQIGYFRLHGRNAEAWFDAAAGRDETYNYYYSRPERDRLVARAQRISKQFRSLTVVANNHYQGKEVANALQIKAALANAPVAVPPRLLDRYAELRVIADEESMARWRAEQSAKPQELF